MNVPQVLIIAAVAVLAAGLAAIVCWQVRSSALRAVAAGLFASSQIAIVGFLALMIGADDGECPLWVAVVVLAASVLCVASDVFLTRAMEGALDRRYGAEHIRMLEDQMAMLRERDALLQAESERARSVRTQMEAELVEALRRFDRLEGAQAVAQAEGAMRLLDAAPARLCEHRVVDALLAGKSRACEEQGIRFRSQVSLPSDVPFPSSVLVALFANAIDNAIAACARVPQADRFVDVRARFEAGFLLIVIRNACAPDAAAPSRRQRAALGGKHPEHGWGISIMRDLVARYGGSVQAHREGATFEARIAVEAKARR